MTAKGTVFAAYGHDCAVLSKADVDVVLKFISGNSLCDKIRRCFIRLILVSEKCKVHTSNLRSFGDFLREQERQLVYYPNRIHPQSLLRLIWEIFVICLIFLDVILHCIDLQFVYQKNNLTKTLEWTISRTSIEILLLHNILIGLITGYYDNIVQEIVFVFKKIALHNLKTDVIFFISVVPIQIPITNYLPQKQKPWIIIFYLIKLPILFTFHGYFKRVLEFFEVKHHVYLKLITIIYMIIYVHLMCCYLIFVITMVENKGDKIYKKQNNMNIYIHGLYHASVVLSNSVYGTKKKHNHLEDLFVCICWYLSSLFKIFVLACFMDSVKVSTSSKSRYLTLEHELDEYMRHKQLPLHMRKRIYTYYDFRFQKRYFREDEILNTISSQLKQEINMHACKKLVENVSFFRNLPMNLLVKIISCLKIQVFLTNDVIIRCGAPGKSMYFISTGTVAVFTKSGKEICHLKDGDHFGEISLLYKDALRIATVISIEISEIYMLDKKDFYKAIFPYPDMLSSIQTIAADRMENVYMLEYNKVNWPKEI